MKQTKSQNKNHPLSATLQKLGSSLMLPVACLPVAGILIGVGYWLVSYESIALPAQFLIQAGQAIINNIPILFAVGIAVGMAEKRDGVAALSGLVSWLIITTLISAESAAVLRPGMPSHAFEHSDNVFIAIIAGLIGAWSYNRFKRTQLPDFLAFFSGKRSVAIMSGAISCVAALLLLFIWPLLYNALISVGKAIISTGAVGAGIYTFLNRLLIPFGLHHALNQVFWFDLAGINDLGNFWSGNGTFGQTGMYMSGFFPIMMFGLPAAALAMYHTALASQKKKAGAILLAAAISSFFTGVTEPLEFSFMFAAPLLYLIHALLSGLTAFVVAALPIRVGFNFSAGLVDFILCLKAPMTQHPWGIWIVGIGVAIAYYFLFRWCIKLFRLTTLGREKEDMSSYSLVDKSSENPGIEANSQADTQASIILRALGGKDNITDFDHCTTRLRIVVKNGSLVDDKAIKASKVSGIIHLDDTSLQIVVGPKVQFLADDIKKLL